MDRDPELRLTPREALAKALAIRRELGWRVLFWRTLGWAGLRRVVLFRRASESAGADQPARASVELGEAGRDSLGEYLEFRPDADVSELDLRFELGDMCHVARANGRIVAARWSSTREVRIPYLNYRSALGPGQAYLYDAYTTPAYRKQGIVGGVTRHAVGLLREQGVHEILSAADPANPAGSGLNHSDGTPVQTLVAIGRRRRRPLALRPRRASRGRHAITVTGA